MFLFFFSPHQLSSKFPTLDLFVQSPNLSILSFNSQQTLQKLVEWRTHEISKVKREASSPQNRRFKASMEILRSTFVICMLFVLYFNKQQRNSVISSAAQEVYLQACLNSPGQSKVNNPWKSLMAFSSRPQSQGSCVSGWRPATHLVLTGKANEQRIRSKKEAYSTLRCQSSWPFSVVNMGCCYPNPDIRSWKYLK